MVGTVRRKPIILEMGNIPVGTIEIDREYKKSYTLEYKEAILVIRVSNLDRNI